MKVKFQNNKINDNQLRLPIERTRGLVRTSAELHKALVKAVKKEINKIKKEDFYQINTAVKIECNYPTAFVSLFDVEGDVLVVSVVFSIMAEGLLQEEFIKKLLEKSGIENPDVRLNV